MTKNSKLPHCLQDSLSDRVFLGLPGIGGNQFVANPLLALHKLVPLQFIGLTHRETLQGLMLGFFARCTEPKEK